MSGVPSPGASLEAVDEGTGDPSTTENHAAAEGTEASDDVGSKSTLREMLLSTGPEQSLEEVESPWDPERGGMDRIYRGIQKAIDVSGMPAVVDVVIGTFEVLNQSGDDDAGDAESSDQEASADAGTGDAGGKVTADELLNEGVEGAN